jgi:hypothetical protein
MKYLYGVTLPFLLSINVRGFDIGMRTWRARADRTCNAAWTRPRTHRLHGSQPALVVATIINVHAVVSVTLCSEKLHIWVKWMSTLALLTEYLSRNQISRKNIIPVQSSTRGSGTLTTLNLAFI